MTTYNTGNPLGSTDARDLYDNAQNLDNFANGAAASYTDRFGVSRRSLAGIDAAADNVLNSIGYAVPVAYASGISLTLTSQTIEYNGVVYAPTSSALPFTTSSWGTDSAKFRAVQVTDADLITYTPAGTGAVAKTVEEVLRETVSAFRFMTPAQIADVQAGTLTVDVTAALQAFVNACQNRRGYIPAGKYKITSALVLDPQYSYIIEGDGWDPNANTGTAIWNYGVGNAIQIHGAGGYDQQIRLADMAIAGNASSQCGVSVIKTLVFFENLWITSHGFHGLRLEDAFSSSFRQCTVTQNFQHGVYVYRQGNALLFDHCVINGNSRANGYSNCTLTGAAGAENLGVTFVACDFTSAGYPVEVTAAYGLVVQHSRAVNMIGCYLEQNKLRNVYADTSVKGLTITGNYFQDGINEISGVDGLIYENNFHQQVYATTRADIASSSGARLPFRLHGNTYTGGASSNYTGGTKERAEIYNTAAPSSGTWQHGDIVWHSLPYSGGNIGWICTTAGTPGTWKSFGTIAA